MPPPPGGNGRDPDPSDDNSDGENRHEIRTGKRHRSPTTPEDDDPQLAKLVKVMSMALGGSKRKPADPPFIYKHLDYQDVKVWLLACEDYFARNPTYWMKEEDKTIYAIGRIEGKEVAPFALAYRKQMTGELGFQKQEGYEYWHIFKAEVILRFTVSHEAERALRRMELVKYQEDIEKYLLELENLNIQAQVTGIAWQYMVEKRLPLEALRRLSNQEYGSDPERLAAIRTVTKSEEAFKEQRGLGHEPSMKSDSSGKREREKDSGEKTSRKSTLHRRKPPIKQKRQEKKWGMRDMMDKKWNTRTSKMVIRVSTKTKWTSCERTMVVPVAAFQVIDGRTVANLFRYQLSTDERSTTETRGNFVPSFNREDQRSPMWLIEAGKEIQIK